MNICTEMIADQLPAMSPERALWSAVIVRAISDAVAPDADPAGRAAHRDAISWFRSEGRNFRLACALAGVEPEPVARAVRAAIADPGEAAAIIARMYAGEDAGLRASQRAVRAHKSSRRTPA